MSSGRIASRTLTFSFLTAVASNRTGEAPSEGLRGVFARFREWLVSIYSDVRVAGIEVNPEVAEVFDRWLASEQEIEAVREKHSPLKELAASMNLEGDVAAKLAAYIDDVKSAGEEKLYRQMMREQRRLQASPSIHWGRSCSNGYRWR